MVNGKAKLLRDDYCDGLGDCLPACPTGAISFVEREAAAYDEAAVQAEQGRRSQAAHCPAAVPGSARQAAPTPRGAAAPQPRAGSPSQLGQWPVQIKLVPGQGALFPGREAADRRRLHRLRLRATSTQDFMRGQITLVGCPKLDSVDYSEKLTEILRQNDIKSVTVVRMEVPCCGGLEQAAMTRAAEQRQVHPLAGGDPLHRRPDFGLSPQEKKRDGSARFPIPFCV